MKKFLIAAAAAVFALGMSTAVFADENISPNPTPGGNTPVPPKGSSPETGMATSTSNIILFGGLAVLFSAAGVTVVLRRQSDK